MTEFTLKTPHAYYSGCLLEVCGTDRISIGIYNADGPIADLTTDISSFRMSDPDYNCVDTNNCPWATRLIKELGIGEYAGFEWVSGFCAYPVYKFDRKAIKKYVGG